MAERLGELTEQLRQGPTKRDFLQAVWCVAKAVSSGTDAAQEAARFRSLRLETFFTKAGVSAGGTQSANWGDELFSFGALASEWVVTLSKRTVRGRLATVPVNFRSRTIVDASAGTASFVAGGGAIPVQAFDLSATAVMEPLKNATIAVFTDESLQVWNNTTMRNVEERLTLAIARGDDAAFLDPDSAAVAGQRPASALNGISPLGTITNSAASALAGVELILASLVNGGSDLQSAALVMHPRSALALSLMQGSNANAVFPALTATGGSIFGIPVYTSIACVRSGSPTERFVAAIDGSRIVTAGDGRVEIDASKVATIEMDSAPTASSITPTAASGVSMFQTGSVAIKAVRYTNWARAHASGVAWVTSAV
jgi:hypothetical protein